MQIKQISQTYSVSPQITPDDLPEIAEKGFKTIICNRPDVEVDSEFSAYALRIATEAAGLKFVENPITHAGLSEDMVRLQRAEIDLSAGPTLAYCASGTRSTIVWALGQAGRMPTEEIIAAAKRAGYDIGGITPRLEALAGL